MSNEVGADGLAGCFRCFFVWHPRTPDPARCPRCKSKLWDVPKLSKLRQGGGLGIDQIIVPRQSEFLELVRRHRAHSPRVFGSVARGTATHRSDLDLLVEFEPGASALDHIGLMQDLEDLLGRPVEVATASSLHWIVRPQALLEALPVIRRESSGVETVSR
jgi:uncharacterized protein